MDKDENIVSGPEYKGKLFHGSIAEYLIPIMKKHPPDFICQIDSSTGKKITSRDFLKLCLDFTEGLVKFGVSKGDVVLHACRNSINCLATALAVVFSGGSLSPMDQSLKPFEIQYLVKILKPKFAICDPEDVEKIRGCAEKLGFETKFIVLDYEASSISGYFSLADIKVDVDVNSYKPRKTDDPKKDVALIMCSSGSTGMPKGVCLSHFSTLFNNIIISDVIVAEPGQPLVMSSPLFWITGILLMLLSCTFQSTRICIKSLYSDECLEVIEKYKPSSILLSPPAILFMVEHPNFKKTNTSSLKTIWTGGCMLTSGVIDKVKSIWKDVEVDQAYGMTEMAGIISGRAPGDDPLSVGRLKANSQMKVVDPETGKSLGPNQVGEYRFKTERMMLGYYNNEEATKAAFDDEGWLKTGDLGYYTEDGLLYITGRVKEMIKYRNFQIYPSEIEGFISSLPGVADAGVLAIAHELDYYLKAVVVKTHDSKITAEEIIKGVEENFSEYKRLKEGVEFVDSLPRSDIGKLKRWKLQEKYGKNEK